MIANKTGWVGQDIAAGRYQILGRFAEGSMAHVYRAFDRRLETDVVIKFPIPSDPTLEGPEFLERFAREFRSLVRLSHPHIVKIIDVGAEEGMPYVVMHYLSGGSLKDRLESGPHSEVTPMAPSSLRDWLPDIARALDFLHAQHHVHRDVKPSNILFDEHGNAFMSDFGLIKALASGNPALQNGSLTAAGFTMGTPKYLAPELVMGEPYDGRVDQYSLAMSVHEIIAGSVFLEGPTPSATMVNQTKVPPAPLTDFVPGVPRCLVDAVLRGLSKDPSGRFESCSAFAHAALADVPSLPSSGSQLARQIAKPGTSSRGDVGRVPCPACLSILPVRAEHAGLRARCKHCQAISRVEVTDNVVQLTLISPPKAKSAETRNGGGTSASASASRSIARPDPSPSTSGSASWPPAPSRARTSSGSGTAARVSPPVDDPGEIPKDEAPSAFSLRRSRPVQVGALLLVIVAAFILGRYFLGEPEKSHIIVKGPALTIRVDPTDDPGPAIPNPAATHEPEPVGINIAYGTEKKKWLEESLAAFEATPAGKRSKIHLIGLGSVEGAEAVYRGEEFIAKGEAEPTPIHVWSPASSAYRNVFVNEWEIQHDGRSPILKAENLALTPMVFVMWKSRYEAFVKKYGKVSFETISRAMQEPAGWGSIAKKPEWGFFKFSHTNPNQSNSGMLSLVLMGYASAHKVQDLTLTDITGEEFQAWLARFEQGVARPGGKLVHSTGDLMKDMVLRGPSQFDCLILYENLAVDYLKSAQDNWGELYVAYPDPSMWNEHPYYVLDVPWSSRDQRVAASKFLDFLMSEPIQRRALEHGFRPGNTRVPVRTPDSPLVKNERFGLRIELPRMVEPPKAEVLNNLLASFRRIER